MECSIKGEKIQGLKKRNKRAQIFLYNIILYSLTSCITCLFFLHPFWHPSMKQLLFSLSTNISLFFNAKCFFILGNIIVLILVGESKRTQSSHPTPTVEIYDEYIARSRRYAKTNPKIHAKAKEDDTAFIPSSNHVDAGHIIQEKMHTHEGKRKGLRRSTSSTQECKKGMRMCKTEVWGKSELEKIDKNDTKLIPRLNNVEEGDIVHHQEVKKKELSSSKSLLKRQDEENKNGMRKCKSEVWGENQIVKLKPSKERKEDRLCIQTEELNQKVEAFIAKVNKRRLLETKSVDLC